MQRNNSFKGNSIATIVLALVLTACGGGGGNNTANTQPVPPTPNPTVVAYQDSAVYSASPSASLSEAKEGAAITQHSISLSSGTIAYTATAGHLTASAPQTNAPEASFFYVAYTANNQVQKNRPVTFFYNGGPGTDTVWLHLGSFGPKRLATGFPSLALNGQFAFVDNAESLLNVSDLVFVNAIGTGYSQAIAPNTNASFWGVDADAAAFRNFVQRYIAVNGRQESPKFLFGESYGGIRTGVLASLLESAGVRLDGVILQAPAMNMNYECAPSSASQCGGQLPTLAATAQYFQLAPNANRNLPAYMQQMRDFNASQYSPALLQKIQQGTPLSSKMLADLTGFAGLTANDWQTNAGLDNYDVSPFYFINKLKPGFRVGRLDSRVIVPNDSPLAANFADPSFDYIKPAFATTINSYLRDTLKYSNNSTYVLESSANSRWNYQHAGQESPDVIPDLGAAMRLNPQLRVLNMNGYYDLATPFHVTELELARLNLANRIAIRNYASGHMSYLDDQARALQYADLVAFYRNNLPSVQTFAQAHVQAKNIVSAPLSLSQVSASANSSRASIPAGSFLANTAEPKPMRKAKPMPSQGEDLQKEIEARLQKQFERVAGSSISGATREQLQAAGLDYLATHFSEIDSKKRGRIYFQDWMNYLKNSQDKK